MQLGGAEREVQANLANALQQVEVMVRLNGWVRLLLLIGLFIN